MAQIFKYKCIGSSDDCRTNKWRVTCECGKVWNPQTTRLAYQDVVCPKCGKGERVNYNTVKETD